MSKSPTTAKKAGASLPPPLPTRKKKVKEPEFAVKAQPWKPHKYQTKAAKFLVDRAAAGLFLDPGLGKTSSTLAALSVLKEKGMFRKALILAPLRVARNVWPAEVKKWKEFSHLKVVVLHGPKKDELLKEEADIYVMNFEGLDWLLGATQKRNFLGKMSTTYTHENLKKIDPEILVVDECFPAGTQVRTPACEVAIEKLAVGDVVDTGFGEYPIKRIIRKVADKLVRLYLDNGKEIVCTPNHPILTDGGWVRAENCHGRSTYGPREVCTVREGLSLPSLSPEEVSHWHGVLREVLCIPGALGASPGMERICSEDHAAHHGRSAPVEYRGGVVRDCEGEAAGLLEGGRTTEGEVHRAEGRERENLPGGGTGSEDSLGEFSVEPCSGHGRVTLQRVPNLLQAGLRESAQDAGNRGGRIQPQLRREEVSGPEEGRLATGPRVVRVESFQPTGPSDVWNLEVDGAPYYFADGTLVHNCSKVKNATTGRFKALKTALPKFQRRWILTGTPAPNGMLDLFGQVYTMDLGKSLGQYITRYKMDYFINLDRQGWKWAIKPGAEEEIYKKLRPYVLRMGAKDYLELPEMIENLIYVDLPQKARRVYEDLEDEFFSVLDSGVNVMAPSAGSARMKLLQLANGAMYDGVDGRSWTHFHDEKLDALVDLVDELQGSPLLAGYQFKHDLERLQKVFGKDVPRLGEGVSPAREAEICRDWNAGNLPLLLGHPRSMGHGLNLQGSCRHVAWFGLNDDYELDDQFNKRVLRQGNKFESATIHRFIARNTVEVAVLRNLRRKEKDQGALLDALKEYKKERSNGKN
jgi:hypothetical protein